MGTAGAASVGSREQRAPASPPGATARGVCVPVALGVTLPEQLYNEGNHINVVVHPDWLVCSKTRPSDQIKRRRPESVYVSSVVPDPHPLNRRDVHFLTVFTWPVRKTANSRTNAGRKSLKDFLEE
ncbi:hypothetical protein UY3_08030 [Chelonia mydas]|uniref:Uncharacterized protein n=1 Tax=Chelonia mydas TaxID=8469 RepID=M7BRW4_CHEMY|nr:hypothetical protein UY3_08030 [Chelonia mydas]